MTPEDAIAILDRQLQSREDVILRIYTNPTLTTYDDHPIKARIYTPSQEEIAAGMSVDARKVITSPSEIPTGVVVRIGKDAIMVGGNKNTITLWEPTRIGTTIVRIDGRIG